MSKTQTLLTFFQHDTTLNALLGVLGVDQQILQDDVVQYAATVVIQLWNVEGNGPAVKASPAKFQIVKSQSIFLPTFFN